MKVSFNVNVVFVMGKTNEKTLRRSERLLNRQHSLPTFEEDSSNESDEDAIFELNELSDDVGVIESGSSDDSVDGSEDDESV